MPFPGTQYICYQGPLSSTWAHCISSAPSACSRCRRCCCCPLQCELCRRSRPQIMIFVFPAFTLSPFSSIASFQVKCLQTHSSSDSGMSFEEFQDGNCGSHLGYPNSTILVILNLCVALMPPIKFQLNPTYNLGGDVVWRYSRSPTVRPSWILERMIFAVLNLHVDPMPPTKFGLNLT